MSRKWKTFQIYPNKTKIHFLLFSINTVENNSYSTILYEEYCSLYLFNVFGFTTNDIYVTTELSISMYKT